MKPISFAATLLAGLLAGSTFCAAASLHTRVYQTSAIFTVPAAATTSTEFEFTVVGGGGGGGDCKSGAAGSGGGSGGSGMAVFIGFNPSDAVTITIGAGGAAGTANGHGSPGLATTLNYSSVDIVSATGGGGGLGVQAAGGAKQAGAAGTLTVTATGTGLTQESKLDFVSEEGVTVTACCFLPAGNNGVGHSGTFSHPAGAVGGGGLGCFNNYNNSGAGGAGAVIVRWYS